MAPPVLVGFNFPIGVPRFLAQKSFAPTVWDSGPITFSGAGGLGCQDDPAAEYLLRVTGLDTQHQNAFGDFIRGAVTDGFFWKFDALYIGNDTSAHSLQNLIFGAYTGTIVGSPNFWADHGFAGTNSNTSPDYIDTGFNASTAPSPKHSQNSA